MTWKVVRMLALAALVSLVGPVAGASVLPTDFGADDGQPFEPSRPSLSGLQTEVQNLNTGEWFATIFDALADPDTLNGHTLQVAAALLIEGQVLVSKSVTLQGASGPLQVQLVAPAIKRPHAQDEKRP